MKAERFGGFRLYALGLLVVMFLAYDSQVWRMGFYYDDWEGIFLYKLNLTNLQIWQYFLVDRPFSALIHFVFNPIFGASSAGWHVLGVIVNWLAILFFVKTMLEIWPKQIMPIAWMGFLLALYPGISRQFVIRTSMPHYTSMLLFMLSLWLMILAFKNKSQRIWLIFASILLGIFQTLLVEFFGGLELIRFFLLFYLVWQENGTFKQTLIKTVKHWLPYISIFVFFIAFKFFILPSMQLPGAQPKHMRKILELFGGDFINTFFEYANLILQDIIHSLFYVWTLAITPQQIDLQSKAFSASWALGLLAALVAVLIIKGWARKENEDSNTPIFIHLIILIAVLALIFGGLPSWAIGKQAAVGRWSSRFLFGQIFGAVPLIVLFIFWITGKNRRSVQYFLLALLLAGSFSVQFRTANDYALDWDSQRQFFWQLKWRAPALSPQAFIVSPQAATRLTVDYQMAYAINVLYASGHAQTTMPHWWFNGPEELRSVKAGEANSERWVGRTFRTIKFESNMTYAVPVLSNLSRGCLLIADPLYQDAPLLTESEKRLFLTSHPERILAEETTPMPTDVFGAEPEHTWCYFFTKADLARQYAQWDEGIKLWQEAADLGYTPTYGPEYWPFIEAFAKQGDWQAAVELTQKANELTEAMPPFLCGNWQRIMLETQKSESQTQAWNQIQPLLSCKIN